MNIMILQTNSNSQAVIVIALVGAILQTISITTSKWPPTPTPAVGPFLIAFVYGVSSAKNIICQKHNAKV
jgi:hypothetical protein